jgi:hypothetical protein
MSITELAYDDCNGLTINILPPPYLLLERKITITELIYDDHLTSKFLKCVHIHISSLAFFISLVLDVKF